jgi:hypothetical protein
MPGQNSYTSAALTTAQVDYSTAPAAYAPTTTPPLYGINYQDAFGTITTITTTVSGDNDGDEWSGHISGPTRDQGAIIALGVVCGLLTIGLAVLLLFLLYQTRQNLKKTEAELVISPGYQAMGRQKHRRDRTEYGRETDDATDYLPGLNGFYAPRKHRGHRRSQPVTRDEYQKAAHWRNVAAQQPAAPYAQFAKPGPVYFSPGQGNEGAVPVVQVPMPAQVPQPQRGVEEVMSSTEHSEVSSSSQGRPPGHRQSSVRRHHSRTSSSHEGGGSGRR